MIPQPVVCADVLQGHIMLSGFLLIVQYNTETTALFCYMGDATEQSIMISVVLQGIFYSIQVLNLIRKLATGQLDMHSIYSV